MQATDRFEILVVGAGPCGIAVGAAAKTAGVSCALFDKGCITSSLLNYPYYMTFFSTARMLEIGDVPERNRFYLLYLFIQHSISSQINVVHMTWYFLSINNIDHSSSLHGPPLNPICSFQL